MLSFWPTLCRNTSSTGLGVRRGEGVPISPAQLQLCWQRDMQWHSFCRGCWAGKFVWCKQGSAPGSCCMHRSLLARRAWLSAAERQNFTCPLPWARWKHVGEGRGGRERLLLWAGMRSMKLVAAPGSAGMGGEREPVTQPVPCSFLLSSCGGGW